MKPIEDLATSIVVIVMLIPLALVKAYVVLSLFASGVTAVAGYCGKDVWLGHWVSTELMCPVEDASTRR